MIHQLQKQIEISWSNLPSNWNLCLQLKIDLKDKSLKREIGNFLILNIQDYPPLKSIIDDHKEFISLNEVDSIINNLDVKKALCIDRIMIASTIN